MADVDELGSLLRGCSRQLQLDGARDPATLLGSIDVGVEVDRYGEGGVVEELEGEVAALLDKPAAVFMPSGTMAQQIALRLHADDRGTRTVALHPTSHLDRHEGGAYERLHGLRGRHVGDAGGLVTVEDLAAVAEPLAAVVLELPQRETGGHLPDWDDLVACTSWARERGVATHVDGARLWQCAPAYDRPLGDVAALFDTVYVSFYKDLGGLAGCCLLGDERFVERAREWRQRHGGTLFAMWPYAAAALAGLRARLPRMAAYHAHLQAIAAELRRVPGVRLRPDPPRATMVHVLLRMPHASFEDGVRRAAERYDVGTWRRPWPTDHPDWLGVELSVGDATLELTPAEVRDVVACMLEVDDG